MQPVAWIFLRVLVCLLVAIIAYLHFTKVEIAPVADEIERQTDILQVERERRQMEDEE